MGKLTPWGRKLIGLRYNYGDSAALYFDANPKCEDCGEDRIFVLHVHHTQGKKVDLFRTLCANCHMLEHAQAPEYTKADHVAHVAKKDAKVAALKDREARVHELHANGKSLRDIAKALEISHFTVFNTLKAALSLAPAPLSE